MKSLLPIVLMLQLSGTVWSRPGVELKLEHRSDPEELVTNLPFYGGAKGQVLQIKRNPDGTITTEIIKQDKVEIEKEISEDMNSFQENLNNIQRAASELVALQQTIKNSGKLTEEDRTKYSVNLEKLGISAQNLAHIQQSSDRDDFRLLFQGPLFNKQQQDVEKPEDNDNNEEEEEENEDVGEESENSEDGEEEKPEDKPDTDSIQVNSPDKDASIAEAKPVGLAIAGQGGVASSKPVATAVVGPGGLAIARPIATAIAGISPSEVQGLGIPIGSHKTITKFQSINIPTASRYGLMSLSNGIGLLVGPNFSHESRVPGKDISADDSHKEELNAEEEDKEEKSDDKQSKLDKVSNESDNENKRQEQTPFAGQQQHVTSNFQGNQPFPGPQHFQSTNPFPMGPPNFHQGFQSGPQLHGHNQGSNLSQQQQPNQHPHSPDSILPGQYPFIPPVAPYRFNWDTLPIESSQSYEPIPFMDNRAFNPAPVYPFIPPVNPFQFYQQFQRQY